MVDLSDWIWKSHPSHFPSLEVVRFGTSIFDYESLQIGFEEKRLPHYHRFSFNLLIHDKP